MRRWGSHYLVSAHEDRANKSTNVDGTCHKNDEQHKKIVDAGKKQSTALVDKVSEKR